MTYTQKTKIQKHIVGYKRA